MIKGDSPQSLRAPGSESGAGCDETNQVFLSFDIGEKRVGVAWGDSEVKIASPYGVLLMDETILDEIKKLIDKFKPTALIVGLPRNSKGEETKQSQYVRDFATKLETFGLPIVFQDESLTSVIAEDMLSNKQRSNKYNNGKIDASAASIILSDYLEANFG